MPTPRFGHSSSVVDGKIYVIGGGGALTKVEMYDPVTDTWTAKADMPTGRLWLSTSVVDGKIYAIGGALGPGWASPSTATVEMYDQNTNTWTTKADMPMARQDLATVVLDGKIYAIGGALRSEDETYRPTTSVEAYDPATDTWTTKTSMIGYTQPTSAVVIEGKIYATNGLSSEVYDPTRDVWLPMANLGESSVLVTSACELEGRMYTFGGATLPEGVPHSSTFVFDPIMDSWSQLADMSFSAWWMAASEVDGKIYLFGGLEQEWEESFENLQPQSSVWEVSVEQSTTASVPPADTTEPISCESVDENCIEIRFDEKSCTHIGPEIVQPGPITFIFHNQSSKWAGFGSGKIDEGKTWADVLDHYGPPGSEVIGPPPWSTTLVTAMTKPVGSIMRQATFDTGIYFSVCYLRGPPHYAWAGAPLTVED
jgi:hypothetical protein